MAKPGVLHNILRISVDLLTSTDSSSSAAVHGLWADQARAELERIGPRRTSGADLTEGERRVAELAAHGLTNRQVAAALFMSPKTVEANLSRAYQKLNVRLPRRARRANNRARTNIGKHPM
jgi:DNA-binding NarL/FixJ family response regulator